MASKVMLGVAQPGFLSQGSKRREEVVSYFGSTSTNPELRVKQLEQNIRFLQEQHQIMLSGLHREIEVLRRRNRDLQFQMVFSKGSVTIIDETPDTSPKEDCVVSPGTNFTPLQVELLERDVAELKTLLGEAQTRNMYLQSVVDNLKKTIQTLEDERSEMAAVGLKLAPEKVTPKTKEVLKDKLEESERLVSRLRRENEEQRKEIMSLRSAMTTDRRKEGRYNRSDTEATRFPPLYPNYQWRSCDQGKRDNRPGRGEETAVSSLPLLKERNSSTSEYWGSHQGNQGSRRGYGFQYRGSRTYRNQNKQSQFQ